MESKLKDGWIDPSGKFFDLGRDAHVSWMENRLGIKCSGAQEWEDIMAKSYNDGWIRVSEGSLIGKSIDRLAGWIDPDGNLFKFDPNTTHAEWITANKQLLGNWYSINFNGKSSLDLKEALLDRGWIRVRNGVVCP